MFIKIRNHIFLGILLCIPFLVSAKTTTWTAGFTTNWNDAGNWDNGIPINGDIVKFDLFSQGTSIMDIPNLTLSELDMSSSLACNLMMAADNLVISGDLKTTNVFSTGAYNITINGNFETSSFSVFEVSAGAIIIVHGTVMGGGSVAQDGGIFRFSNPIVNLASFQDFNVTNGIVELNGSGNQSMIVTNNTFFYNLNLLGGGTKTINGPLTLQQDLILESGTFINIKTSATIDRDFIGLGSFVNASASSLLEVGRSLQVAAYTPGSLLKFSGTDDANWYRAGGSNYGAVEITGDKTVSLSPQFGQLPWHSGNLIVHGGATLNINGNYLETFSMKVGGVTHGTITNAINVARGIIIKGNVDLGSKAYIPQFGGFGLASRIAWTITQPGELIVNGDSTILESLVINTGGTVHGYGNLITGVGSGAICAGFCVYGGELIWDASDIETAGGIGLYGNFTMSPSNTLTINNITAPSSFYPGGNVIAGNLLIAGNQIVLMGEDIASGTIPVNVILGKDLIIENGARIKNEESELTVDGDVFNSGTMQVDSTLTVHGSLMNSGLLEIDEDQKVIVKSGN